MPSKYSEKAEKKIKEELRQHEKEVLKIKGDKKDKDQKRVVGRNEERKSERDKIHVVTNH